GACCGPRRSPVVVPGRATCCWSRCWPTPPARPRCRPRSAVAEPGATALDALWALWSTAGLAEGWRRSAVAGGPGGARADHDLDAVLALFTAAEQFTDR